MTKLVITILLVIAVAAGCVAPPPVTTSQPGAEQAVASAPAAAAITSTLPAGSPAGGAGFGPESGMMERHHAEIPAQYADLVNTTPADADSLQRGQMVYAAQCESCHGASGMGEGPAGQALDPAPAPIAHTSQMLSDGYLFWRISEGGHSFATAMPAWGEALSEQERWDLINYTRSLEGDMGMGMAHGQGMGGMGRGQGMGGQMMQRQGQMLNAALDAGLISEDDVAFFQRIQQLLLDKYGGGRPGQGRLVEQAVSSGQAVTDGVISQADAERYTEIHNKMMQVEHTP